MFDTSHSGIISGLRVRSTSRQTIEQQKSINPLPLDDVNESGCWGIFIIYGIVVGVDANSQSTKKASHLNHAELYRDNGRQKLTISNPTTWLTTEIPIPATLPTGKIS